MKKVPISEDFFNIGGGYRDRTDDLLNKRPVGERLALFAQGVVYGESIQYTGPSYDSVLFR